jgi:uncharacterized membrane protein
VDCTTADAGDSFCSIQVNQRWFKHERMDTVVLSLTYPYPYSTARCCCCGCYFGNAHELRMQRLTHKAVQGTRSILVHIQHCFTLNTYYTEQRSSPLAMLTILLPLRMACTIVVFIIDMMATDNSALLAFLVRRNGARWRISSSPRSLVSR